PKVKINIYHCTAAGKVKGDFNIPMTDEDIKEIKILAGRFGNQFYNKDELKRKVDSLDDPKLFD
ncbi:8072_t:CDS:1, partial [Ambispora leptoticha]